MLKGVETYSTPKTTQLERQAEMSSDKHCKFGGTDEKTVEKSGERKSQLPVVVLEGGQQETGAKDKRERGSV